VLFWQFHIDSNRLTNKVLGQRLILAATITPSGFASAHNRSWREIEPLFLTQFSSFSGTLYAKSQIERDGVPTGEKDAK
jgi:hypothetical protein